MRFKEYIASQMGNPRGFVGKICCIIMNIINKKMYKEACLLIDPDSSCNILDIGFGNGYLIKKLLKRTNANIYGIDISLDMLKKASKRNKKGIKNNRLFLSLGDCCNMPYDKNNFNYITSINTIYFWNDTLTGLKCIKDVLADDGIFFNIVYTKEWLNKISYTKTGFKKFEEEEYVSLGKEAGYSEVSIKELVKGKSLVVIYKK